jgi:probable F420-dependent oxidoreductase
MRITSPGETKEFAMKLGKLGVWAAMDTMTAAEGAAFAKRVEGWGYAALWLPESRGRNVLVHSSWLLANTTTLIVAPGIGNIYARDAMAMANGQRALAEQSGGRFLLGLGVSHVPSVEGLRGHTYGKPIATMRAYLEAMAAAPYGAPEPPEKPLTILAALGPRMLALSASARQLPAARQLPQQLAPARLRRQRFRRRRLRPLYRRECRVG